MLVALPRGFGFVPGLEQDIPPARGVAALGIEVSEREQHERKKQADFVLAREQRCPVQGGFGFPETAAHQLHQAAAVIRRDHIVGALALFGEIFGLPQAPLGLFEFAQPAVNDGPHHQTEHEQARTRRPRRTLSGASASRALARSRQVFASR